MKGKKLKYLYIPVEIKARELNAKILLSLFASEKGFYTVVGKRDTLRKKIRKMGNGIVLEKGLDSPGKEGNIREYKLCGNKVAAIDEEGLVYVEKYYITRRIRKKAIKNIDLFFAWGKNQADLIKDAFPEMAEKIYLCGNSRLDLLRKELQNVYSSEIKVLQSKYGDFILINSALPLVSLKEGLDEYLRKEKQTGFLSNQESVDFFWGRINYHKTIFNEITNMILMINKEFPDKKIIIRPHPSEDPELWKEKVGHLQNVHIIYKGGVIPWLLAAQVMIHHNCTTAIESYLLGKTAISYRTILSKDYDCEITHAASFQVFSIEELINKLKKIINENEITSLSYDLKKELQNYLTATEGEYASELIVKELNSLAPNVNKGLIKYLSVFFKLYYRLYKFVGSNIIKRMFQPSRERNKKEYFDYKFPDTDIKEVISIVEQFIRATGRFSNIKVDSLGNNLFAIYKDQ